jgi:hypothetical protein
MPADALPHTTDSRYAAGPATKPPDWHGLVVLDTLLNGLTTGLFLVAAVGDLVLPAILAPVARLAYPAAFLLLLADLLCLSLDLGHPWRFHHMLRVFKPRSPMSLGVWALTVFSVPALIAAMLSVIPGPDDSLGWARRSAAGIGLLPAFVSAAYKGVLFSTSSQPGWKDARWLGGYFTSSAVLLGGATMLLLAGMKGQDVAVAVLRPAVALLIVLSLVPLGIMLGELHPVSGRRYSRRQWRAGLVLLVIGAAAVLGLLFLGGLLATISAVVVIVLGSAVLRMGIVWLPHNL